MAVSVSRRSTAGIIFVVAGALLVLAVLLPMLGVTQVPWLAALAFLGIAVGFAVMGFGAVNGTLTKIAMIVAAIGWLLLAINAVGVALPAILVTISALVAGIAGLIAAVVLYVGKEVRNTAALVFIAATALGLLYLLGVVGTISLGTVGTVIAVLFGLGLIVAGLMFRQKESRR